MGKPAARITDMHVCPMVNPGPVPHVGGPVAVGSPNVLTGKLPQARVGDMSVCNGPPDVIAVGSTGVFVNKKPAARLGDQTAHGGTIVAGLPTVLIGETKAGGGGGAGAMFAGAAMFQFAEYAAQVQVLIEAFQSGAPFAEICFKNAVAKLKTPAAPAAAKAPAAPAKGPAAPPPAAPAPKQTDKVCEVVDHTISCEHGRKPGPSNRLMVVPGSALGGDTISGAVTMKGGCGEHPAWRVTGARSFQGKGTKYNFRTNAVALTATTPDALKSVSPETYNVEVTSCGAGGKSYTVEAYPSGEASFKLSISSFLKDIKAFLQLMPVPEETKSKWEKSVLVGELKYSGAWKEDDKSWRAYCETTFSGGFSPLIGIEHRGQVYPPNLLPGWLTKYVEAGVFLTVSFGADLSASFAIRYWPDTGKSDFGAKEVSGGGNGTAKLSLDLKLAGPDLVSGSLAGSTGLGVKVAVGHEDEATIAIQPKWDGIKASATLKACWGLVEVNRDFQLVQERSYDAWKWPLSKTEKAS